MRASFQCRSGRGVGLVRPALSAGEPGAKDREGSEPFALLECEQPVKQLVSLAAMGVAVEHVTEQPLGLSEITAVDRAPGLGQLEAERSESGGAGGFAAFLSGDRPFPTALQDLSDDRAQGVG